MFIANTKVFAINGFWGIIMNKEELVLKYISVEDRNLKKYYNFIVDLIYLYNLESFIKKIEFVNDSSFYGYYDNNNKILYFSSSIFSSPLYNNNSSKVIVYIFHEILHVIQHQLVSTCKNDSFIRVLDNSLKGSIIDYSSLLPFYEYQAYVNSNFVLYNILTKGQNVDERENSKRLIRTILYNNYYNYIKRFESPFDREVKKQGLCIKDKIEGYENATSRLLLGLPVNYQEFLEFNYKINSHYDFKGVDFYDLSINKRRIKK